MILTRIIYKIHQNNMTSKTTSIYEPMEYFKKNHNFSYQLQRTSNANINAKWFNQKDDYEYLVNTRIH
jgi:hypothetical protein